ncbi:hypothetical protein JHK87_031681 [Glycine soja]|nr:hypothetical protein JHK87_031681 [Glycine soja]
MAITTETQPQPQQHKYSSRVNCNNPKLCINFDVKLKYKVIFDIPIFCASMDTLMTREESQKNLFHDKIEKWKIFLRETIKLDSVRDGGALSTLDCAKPELLTISGSLIAR